MKLPDGEQMRRIDRCAIDEFGIPGIVLMENAGVATVQLMERLYGDLNRAFIVIFVGPGNNGGDGLVIARHLHQRHSRVLVIFLIDPDRLQGDSSVNLAIFRNLELPSFVCDSTDKVAMAAQLIEQSTLQLGPVKLLVDAIFGTGLCRPVEEHFKEIIELINRLSSAGDIPVIGVDTPSGLDTKTGRILGSCIRARATAAYGCTKIGQLIGEASACTGELHVIDIGIPPEVFERIDVVIQAIDHPAAAEVLHRLQRKADTHKGNCGHLMIIGGSSGKSGAAVLAGRGALRSGCGLVSLFAPKELNPVFETALTEAMTIPLAHSTDRFQIDDLDAIIEHLDSSDCLVIGPGLGQDPATVELVLELYRRLTVPVLLDADALNILAAHQHKLDSPAGARILTPHPGEMARLLSNTTLEIQQDRVDAAQKCWQRYQSGDKELIVILKGAASIVSSDLKQYLNTTGNPGMAVGGMGDVLSGIIGSLICQGLDLASACCLGVFLHGYSADRLYERCGTGYTASEVADELPVAVKHIQEQELKR